MLVIGLVLCSNVCLPLTKYTLDPALVSNERLKCMKNVSLDLLVLVFFISINVHHTPLLLLSFFAGLPGEQLGDTGCRSPHFFP